MSVNEIQLSSWSAAPTSTKIQHTFDEVLKAINSSPTLRQKSIHPYLQGSYANRTNIKVDSDVDVVIQLESTFNHDLRKISAAEQQLFHQVYSNATYHWSDFRKDVIAALKDYFGEENIDTTGNKSIKLAESSTLVNADIVPCLQHRLYNSFTTSGSLDYVEGMKFWTLKENKEIVNFPREHIKNGQSKNSVARTSEMYKKQVRIIKNIKKRLVDQNFLDPKIAPSYFIECLVYNAPDSLFSTSFGATLENILNHILRQIIPNNAVTVSHQQLLFGNEPWQWNIVHAGNFFQQVEKYYQSN